MFETLAQFLHMDGYGLYVWGSYVLAGLAYGGLVWHTVSRHKAIQKNIQAP